MTSSTLRLSLALVALASTGCVQNVGLGRDRITCTMSTSCPSGTVCSAGRCQVVACTADADCPAASSCVSGSCTASGCPATMTACGGACVDLATDAAHCGACGTSCAMGSSCASGVCAALGCAADSDCPAGEVCLGGACSRPACTDADGDGVCAGVDCNDADASIHPGAVETCDGLDNDCDGLVDEGCARACASDADCPAGTTCVSGVCA